MRHASFHQGTSLARLYSYAVDPLFQRQGIGRVLVEAAEQLALERECITLRLEVRRDNPASIKLFESLGYRYLEVVPDYYEDHAAVLRFEKNWRLISTRNWPACPITSGPWISPVGRPR